MKEAFLLGMLSMGGTTGDQDINLLEVVRPVAVTQNGQTVTHLVKEFHYAITPADTRAEEKPHIKRFIK